MLYSLFHSLHNFTSYFNSGFIYKVSRLFEITPYIRSPVGVPSTGTDGVSWNKLSHINPFSIRYFWPHSLPTETQAFCNLHETYSPYNLDTVVGFLARPFKLFVCMMPSRRLAAAFAFSSVSSLSVLLRLIHWDDSRALKAPARWLFLLMVCVGINMKIITYVLLSPVCQARVFWSEGWSLSWVRNSVPGRPPSVSNTRCLFHSFNLVFSSGPLKRRFLSLPIYFWG